MKTFIRPDYLQSGDKIAIVAPAKRILPHELDEEIELIQSWGLEVVLGKNLYHSHYFGYAYAGTLEDRLADFQQALDNPSVKAIWCARGGYGAIQLIDELDFGAFMQHPKWIIGYSDITVFHAKLHQLGYQSIHGVVVKKLNLPYHPESYRSVKQLLFNQSFTYDIPLHPQNKTGQAEGILIGGNLSIVYSLLGSPTSINPNDKILFLEDWYENWYHVDRMMTSLKRAEILPKINGLILGSFTFMDVEEENTAHYTNPFDPTTYQIIHHHLAPYNIPVCFQFPAGHTGHNIAMKFGEKVKLSIQSNSVTLQYI
ncbi:LD-carboxypeptidase [Vaginella massiliensis]|uniref:S66 peptidase family protein n=1 Tax=Vaginella massiliensis TaxID=1816680 RepID=UPI0037539DCC